MKITKSKESLPSTFTHLVNKHQNEKNISEKNNKTMHSNIPISNSHINDTNLANTNICFQENQSNKFINLDEFKNNIPIKKDHFPKNGSFVQKLSKDPMKKNYQSYNEIKINSINNMNNYIFKRNMYIINENPLRQTNPNQPPLNTSINADLNKEGFISNTLLNLDSNSMQVFPNFKNRKIESIANLLGKRGEMQGDMPQEKYRISNHPLESSLLQTQLKNETFQNSSWGQLDNFSIMNNNTDQIGKKTSYANLEDKYNSWKYLPWKEQLNNSKKFEYEPTRKSHFFPQHPLIKSPLTPDYRKLKKRMCYNKQMNLNLKDFNLSNRGSNRSYNCSPFVNHSPMSIFENLKYNQNNKKSIPVSQNSIMDLRSNEGSQQIQYSFKETKLLKETKSPGEKGQLVHKILDLCDKTMKKQSNSYLFNPN
jgi:hypothetical protein